MPRCIYHILCMKYGPLRCGSKYRNSLGELTTRRINSLWHNPPTSLPSDGEIQQARINNAYRSDPAAPHSPPSFSILSEKGLRVEVRGGSGRRAEKKFPGFGGGQRACRREPASGGAAWAPTTPPRKPGPAAARRTTPEMKTAGAGEPFCDHSQAPESLQ